MREGSATEYRGPEGERLYLQFEVAEGTQWVPESMIYATPDRDRIIGVRLLLEHSGVKSVLRLCPDGHRILEQREEWWPEPVTRMLVTIPADTVVLPTEQP